MEDRVEVDQVAVMGDLVEDDQVVEGQVADDQAVGEWMADESEDLAVADSRGVPEDLVKEVGVLFNLVVTGNQEKTQSQDTQLKKTINLVTGKTRHYSLE